jgi:hypothetical protein
MSRLDTLIYGIKTVREVGVDVSSRPALNFIGADVVDDPVNNQTTIDITGTGFTNAGAGLTSSGNTVNVGAGNDIIVNPNDVAVDSTALAVASKIVKRDASAAAAFGFVTVGSSTTAPTSGVIRIKGGGGSVAAIMARISGVDAAIAYIDHDGKALDIADSSWEFNTIHGGFGASSIQVNASGVACSPNVSAPIVKCGAGPYSSVGLVRGTKNSVLVATPNNAGSADITAIETNASDEVLVGDATNTAKVRARVKTGGKFEVLENASTLFEISNNTSACFFLSTMPSGIGFYTAAASTGIRVIATSAPVSLSATNIQFQNNGQQEFLRFLSSTQTTTDATPADITGLNHSVATDKPVQIELDVLAHQVTTGDSRSWKIIGLFENNAGTTSQIGTTTVVHDKGDTGLTLSVLGWSFSGTNVRPQVTGESSKTIQWRLAQKVQVWP